MISNELKGLHPHPFCAILPMWISLLMLNIGMNHCITNQWWELLTNARCSTLNVNGNQGTCYILIVVNRFSEVKWTVEFNLQETLIYFLIKWQGYLPLRNASSRVPNNVSSSDHENVLKSMGWNLLKGKRKISFTVEISYTGAT